MKLTILMAPVSVMMLFWSIYHWENPSVNRNSHIDMHTSIHESIDYKNNGIGSMGSLFDVHYVEHAHKNALNPYFPAIHITTDASHTAWLHVVRTDTVYKESQCFVDAEPDVYPLYTNQQDFYDAPHWRYTLHTKPLSFWEGHAYAVQIDNESKTIRCVGGIGWGFRLTYTALRPQMIVPYPLTVDDWQRDWLVLSKALEGYNLIV